MAKKKNKSKKKGDAKPAEPTAPQGDGSEAAKATDAATKQESTSAAPQNDGSESAASTAADSATETTVADKDQVDSNATESAEVGSVTDQETDTVTGEAETEVAETDSEADETETEPADTETEPEPEAKPDPLLAKDMQNTVAFSMGCATGTAKKMIADLSKDELKQLKVVVRSNDGNQINAIRRLITKARQRAVKPKAPKGKDISGKTETEN